MTSGMNCAGSAKNRTLPAADERAGIGAVLEEIRAVQSLIGPMQSLRGQFQDLADTDLSWDGPAEIQTLLKRVRRLAEGHPEGEAEIERRRKEVLLNLDQGKYTGEQVGAATRLAGLAEKLPSLQMGMKQAISKVESSLVHLRRRMSEAN